MGENWALIVQQKQRGSESRGACGRRACLLRGAGVSGHWLAGGSPRLRARLLQRRVLASQLENLSFGQSRVGKVDEAESCVSRQKGKVNELMLRCEGPRVMRLVPAVGVCFPWGGQPGRLLGTAGFLWSVLTLWDREIRRY